MPHKFARRVVITGLGVISSIGFGWQEFWKNLLAGQNGISEIDYFDTQAYDRKFAGQVKGFDPKQYISSARIPHLGRASQLGVAAAHLAVEDAGFSSNELKSLEDAAVIIGTTMGEPQVMETHNARCFQQGLDYHIRPSHVLRYPANHISGHIAATFGCAGENLVFGNACAAGNFSMDYASALIREGRDVVLSGGVDAFSQIAFTGFHRLVSIADGRCRPFDNNRSGMIPAEGAAILVLEEREHARRRGARIYAEVLGCGTASDAYHMTRPHSRGGVKAVTRALQASGVSADEVDYISAHGTGTPENDKVECEVFHTVFGKRIHDIPVSSIKSMLGHALGAASALESVVCCLSIREGKIPPTINYETPDPECDIDCVPNHYRDHRVRVALNNALAFGGNDACMVLADEAYYDA